MDGKHHGIRDNSTNQRRRSRIPVLRRAKTPENRGRPAIREPRKRQRQKSCPQKSSPIEFPDLK